MLRVWFVTSEASPFVQTGGLAEVCGSLPKHLARLGCGVTLVLPAHRAVKAKLGADGSPRQFAVPGYAETCYVRSHALEPRLGLLAIDCPALFDRPGGPYAGPDSRDYDDNAYRYAFFCHAVAALIAEGSDRVDLVHAHDWPTALLPAVLTRYPARPATVFTIHNLAFLGLCSRAEFEHLRLPEEWWHYERLEFHGQCALLKAGLVFADRITTVSPTYAREILTPAYGHGLDGLLRARAADLSGILNGIDEEVWNPETDPALAATYTAATLERRRVNRRALRAHFGLRADDDAFLLGVVSRLTDQKGIDLILEALAPEGWQCAILGSGEARYERAVRALAAAHPERIACHIGYDEALAHRIFGAVDAFLMPSRFEPCGLAQLYAQRYGAVPIVRRTGGLADSVRDLVADSPTGVVFDAATAAALTAALRRAAALYGTPAQWRAVMRNGMAADHSWTQSARAYLALYRELQRSRTMP